MTNTTIARPRKTTVAVRATAKKASATAKAEPPVYTIHSLDEIQIDTRTTRLEALDEQAARRLTTEIQRTTARLWLLVTEAHDRKAHLALGYETWADYCKAELNISESRSYQFLDTGHVMKVLAAAGLDIESFNPPPTRVIARVKDRLTDVRKVATQALKDANGEDGDPFEAVDKAVRALAREPRKGEANGNGRAAAATAPEPEDEAQAADADDAPEAAQVPDTGGVICPCCLGTGKVTQEVADRILEALQNLD